MIRFGVIGAGNISKTFSEAIKATSASLEAIASRDIEKAKIYQKQYGYKKAYGSYQELYMDPDVDCIYIATPHGLHFEQMMEILDYSKAILCEKAFTLNARQAELVFNKAKTKNVFVMEAMWMRFLPNIKHLKKIIDDGLIGSITKLEVDFCFKASVDQHHRLVRPELGGGALLDVGIYPINLANLLLGKPTSLTSNVEFYSSGVDMSSTITYNYSGVKAILKSSFVHEQKREARIYGEKGYLIVPDFWASEKTYHYNLNHDLIDTYSFNHRINGFEYEIEEVIRRINEKNLESSTMSHKDTLEILRQMDAIRASWKLIYPQEKTY